MKRLFFSLCALLWASIAHANVPCSLPFNLLNGTTADATQVMANYNALITCLQSAAIAGANNDITSLSGLTTPLTRNQGGSPVYIGGPSSGTANAQSVTIVAPTGFSLVTGNTIIFKASLTNTGPMTLSVNATPATPVLTFQQSGQPNAMIGGEVQAGQLVMATYDGANYQLMNASPTFQYTPLTGNHTVTNLDCGKALVFFPTAQITLTVPAAGTLGNCSFTIQNAAAWSAKAGVVLNVSGYSTNSRVLYPGMFGELRALGGTAWIQAPLPFSTVVPVNTPVYVDGNAGNDNNDCLTAATACQTLQYVFMQLLFHNFLITSGSSSPSGGVGGVPGLDVRLVNNPSCVPTTGVNCIHGLHWSGAARATEGHNSVMIECDSGSNVNCTIADNTGGQAIGVYCACFLEVRNVTLAGGSLPNNAVQVEKGMVRIEGGVVLGATGAQAQLSAVYNGALVLEGSTQTNISGGTSASLAQASAGGFIVMDQAAVAFTGATTYSATLQAFNGTISTQGTVWTGGGSVTAPNNAQCAPGGFITTGGAVASIPGTNTPTGCTSSGNGQIN